MAYLLEKAKAFSFRDEHFYTHKQVSTIWKMNSSDPISVKLLTTIHVLNQTNQLWKWTSPHRSTRMNANGTSTDWLGGQYHQYKCSSHSRVPYWWWINKLLTLCHWPHTLDWGCSVRPCTLIQCCTQFLSSYPKLILKIDYSAVPRTIFII